MAGRDDAAPVVVGRVKKLSESPSLARVLDVIERESIDDFKKHLLSDEVIDRVEETSSRRALRSPEETEAYKQRLREVIGSAIEAAEKGER